LSVSRQSSRAARLLARALGVVLAASIRLLAATWRIDASALERITRKVDKARLVGFWHGKYIALFPLLRGLQGSVLIGAGFRGEVIAVICEKLGFTPIRLPHGDRIRALESIRTALSGDALCATPLDGPVGPARVAKSALLSVMAERGAEIVPASVRSTRRLVLRSRWDDREIPLPFSSVRLVVGEPIAIPKSATAFELEQLQRRIAGRLDELESSRCGPDPIPLQTGD
jgi:lysophospholipid acyltransferase (LPLAT)-like uncharacterized protein